MNENMTATERSHPTHIQDSESPTEALVEFFREYSRERPEVLALWCFGIGFVLGWKLKPW